MTPEEQGQLIEDLDHEIERLHALYNQYFMGIEKIEPSVQYKNVERKVQLLRKEQIRNTGLRFRFQMLVQKLGTQTQYWRRICRQIEEGTYQRHLVRAQARLQRVSAAPGPDPQAAADPTPPPDNPSWSLDDFDLDAPLDGSSHETPAPRPGVADLDDPFDDLTDPELRSQLAFARNAGQTGRHKLLDLDDPLDTPLSPPAPSVAQAPKDRPQPRAPTPAPTRPAAFDEERAKAVFKTYLVARQKTHEPIEGLTYEKVRASLFKQHESKNGKVDFKVVIRDGRAVIKTVTKE